MSVRLQHVSIPRPPGSEDLTRAFYGDLSGISRDPGAQQYLRRLEVIWFRIRRQTPSFTASAKSRLGDTSIRHFCLVVDDCGRHASEAQCGRLPALRCRSAIPGRPRFFCRDPFGNIIEFTTIVGDYLELQ